MRRSSFLPIMVLSVALPACAAGMERPGISAAVLRQAEDTPAHFTTSDGTMPEDTCRVWMVDPRDRTSLRLVRSAQFGMTYRGDYEVPEGRYGVGRGELLRLDCLTGEVLGVVRS